MRTWTTPDGLAFEDEQTGDGRIFVAGSLEWDTDNPNGWPLRYAREDEGGHYGAVVVGAIGTMTRTGSAITGTGDLDDEDQADGAELARRLDAGQPLGVSVDLDDMEVEFVLSDPDLVEDEPDVILAAALPTASVMWGPDGTVRMRAPGLRALLAGAGLVAAAGEGDPEDGVVLFTDSMDAVITRVTRARIRGATVLDIPAFARAAIALDAASAPADDSAAPDTPDDADQPAVAASSGPCVPCLQAADEASRALVAAAVVPVAPPRAWFDNPRLREPTPQTIRDNGQVFGHLATWGQCHTGSQGQCILTPHSRTEYAYFHLGDLVTAEGDHLAIGPLTFGGGHADEMLSFRAALAHYDNVGNRFADVRAGEDEHGVWFAGAMRPDVMADDLKMRQVRAAPPSGDWRGIGGGLELIIGHAVNTGGFPTPRVGLAASGQVLSLVAAGARQLVLADRVQRGDLTQLSADVIEAAVQAGIAGYIDQQARADRREQVARLRRMDPRRVALRG
jgi:hypothetical protein